jgi:hypothetical protein
VAAAGTTAAVETQKLRDGVAAAAAALAEAQADIHAVGWLGGELQGQLAKDLRDDRIAAAASMRAAIGPGPPGAFKRP